MNILDFSKQNYYIYTFFKLLNGLCVWSDDLILFGGNPLCQNNPDAIDIHVCLAGLTWMFLFTEM